MKEKNGSKELIVEFKQEREEGKSVCIKEIFFSWGRRIKQWFHEKLFLYSLIHSLRIRYILSFWITFPLEVFLFILFHFPLGEFLRIIQCFFCCQQFVFDSLKYIYTMIVIVFFFENSNMNINFLNYTFISFTFTSLSCHFYSTFI